MEHITLEHLLIATKGTLCGAFQQLQQPITAVDTDSRNLQAQSVFFSLVGERFDAHTFLPTMADSVISGFVISKELEHYSPHKFYVKVEDTHKALGDFAAWYRQQFSIPFIAVTGSVGKTTAKDMIASVLSSKYNVHKTQGNFNNTIGLPLTLFQLERHHEICVLEMGMDTLGEIDYMGRIVKPQVAVITNIGDAHIERLGSRENIKKAKYEIIPHIATDGYLLRSDPHTHGIITVDKIQGVLQPSLTQTYQCLCWTDDGVSTSQGSLASPNHKYEDISLPSLGQHMQYPVLFALAISELYGATAEEIRQGISRFVPTKMRQNQVFLPESITILDDTYNANPQSMKAALSVLSHHKGEKKIAVLGDMLELGDYSKALHQEIGVYVGKQDIDVLITVGEQAHYIGEGCTQGNHVYVCQTKEQALSHIKEHVTPHTTLLFKASRGIALETLVQECITFVQDTYEKV